MAAWPVEALTGDAETLHRRDLAPGRPAAVWSIEVSRAALVLGSTQAPEDVEWELARRHDVEVVRRRSGGGAVLLVPGEVWWCDLAVPTGDPAHCGGPGAQFAWAGDTWVRALVACGVAAGVTTAAAAVRPAPLGRVVCFGAVGPGEVLVTDPVGESERDRSGAPAAGGAGTGAAKLVGLSQRRTRAGARVLGLVHRVWRPELTAALLGPGLARIGRGVEEVAAELSAHVRVAADVGLDLDRDVAGALAGAASMAGTGR